MVTYNFIIFDVESNKSYVIINSLTMLKYLLSFIVSQTFLIPVLFYEFVTQVQKLKIVVI